MKKTLFLAVCSSLIVLTSTSFAAAENKTGNATFSEISTVAEPVSNQQAENARWTLILENELGIYAYNVDSLQFNKNEQDVTDTNIVNVEIRTVFTDKDTLQKLQKNYADKLEKNEQISNCTMEMQFNLKDNTYIVQQMEIYSDRDNLIDAKQNYKKFMPIPKGSFAEIMMKICRQFALDEIVADSIN